MMTDESEPEASLEHRAARMLNITMVSLLLLAGIALGLWSFISSLPTINDLLDALSFDQQQALFRAGGGLMVVVFCLSYLASIARKALKRKA